MSATISRILTAVIAALALGSPAFAQTPQTPAANVTARSVKAVGYQVGAGDTTVDLKPTGQVATASGEAKVEARSSVTSVDAKLKGLGQPMQLGTEFLAYVMWSVSPEGRAVNLGEVRPDKDGRAELKATTQLQTFGLFVTAEPYAAVRQPSELVVIENDVRKNTKGKLFIVENFPLMKRSQYAKAANPLALSVDLKQAPLEMYQARNAVDIARQRGAGKYAPEILSKAEGGLDMAEKALSRKAKSSEVISLARTAMQASEDARAVTAERVEAERVATERATAAARAKAEAESKAAAEAAAAKARADREAAAAKAQADREVADAKARADREAALQAEIAAAREAQLKAEAAAKQAEATRQQEALRAAAAAREAELKNAEAAAAARANAASAEAERARIAAETLRAQLLEQFNRILETRDSVRGLVITMADVLFDTGKYDLRPNTREALARLSGIIVSHPGLKLDIEGHTDSTGSDALNQTLSEQRAGAVRGYLVQQGVPADAVTAKGLGKTSPIADNGTAAGRQKNRRVEMIVSGEVIGVTIGN